MTNGEHYAEKLMDFACVNMSFAVNQDGRLDRCDSIPCDDCRFYVENSKDCSDYRREWIKQEYVPTIDWTKVPVDTKVWVKDGDNSWVREHFAKYDGGRVYTYLYGKTSWSFGRDKSDYIDSWDEAKLADPEDIEKYRIKE